MDLSIYLPATLLRLLARGDRTLLAPMSATNEGAVLFTDVTGFTSLADSLAERGPEGAELLSRVLASAFGAIVGGVDAFSGDIIRFAGDAAIAVWPVEEGRDFDHCLRAAAACGLAIQEALREREPVAGEVLGARVGVTAGTLHEAILGGIGDRFEYLLGGPPIASMGGIADGARPGEVHIASPLLPRLGSGFVASEPSSGESTCLRELEENVELTDRVVPRQVAPDLLRRFVSRALVNRLEAGQSEWLGEFRRVTVVFVSLPGLDSGTQDGLPELHAITRAMQAEVDRFDGSIIQFLVDDKGLVLLSVWGLPHASHEDDSYRAVRATLSILHSLEQKGVSAACGIASGRAFSGLGGALNRREYLVFGTVVNLASRLMNAAGAGRVLCDTATANAVQGQVRCVTLDAMPMKGFSSPIPVFHLLAGEQESARTRSYGMLIGREEPMRRLRQAIASVVRDRGTVPVLVVGDAGIGKSHLLDAFKNEVNLGGHSVLQGTADSVERATPYFAWRAIFRELFAGCSTADALRQELGRRLVDPSLVEWAPLLNVVMPVDLPETDITVQLEGEARADRARDLLVRILQQEAERSPLLIVLDDAHLLDTLSWTLASEVARRVSPCLILLALRPMDRKPAACEKLEALPSCMQVLLQPFGARDAAALARDRLGVEEIPAAITSFISEKSGGNPFFGEQLAFALRDSGRLLMDDGRARLAPGTGDLNEVDLPETVEGVITSRIDLLPPSHQLTLKVASVIGRNFGFSTLRDIHPVIADQPDLVAQMNDLMSRNLIGADPSGGEQGYQFKHVVLQEVAYELLPYAQRRDLHRFVGQWIEQHFGDDLAPQLPLLAHHWTKAKKRSKAIHYLERAGKQALDAFANSEARRFLEQAISMDAGDAPEVDAQQRSRWEWWAGRASLKLSDYEEAARHQDRGLAHLGFAVPRTRLGLVTSLAAQIGRQAWHRLRPHAVVAQSPGERARFLQASDMYQYRSEYGFFNTDVLWALQATMHNLNFAERAGADTELVEAYSALGVIAGIGGLHRIARYYSDRALAMADEIGHAPTQAFVHQLIAVYRHSLGSWELVEHHVDRAIALFHEVGDRFRWEGCLAIEVMLHLHRCRLDQLEATTDRLHQSAFPDSTAQMLAWCHGGRLSASLLRDAPREQTEDRVSSLDRLLGEPLSHGERIWAHGLLAAGKERLGQSTDAHADAVQALTLAREHPPGTYFDLRPLDAVADVLRKHWLEARDTADASHVGRLARHAVKVLHAFSRLVPVATPAWRLHQGAMAQAQGRTRVALRSWKRAVASAQRLQLPWDEGRALLALGQSSVLPERERARQLRRAYRIFDRLGTPREARESQETLVRLGVKV